MTWQVTEQGNKRSNAVRQNARANKGVSSCGREGGGGGGGKEKETADYRGSHVMYPVLQWQSYILSFV